MKSEWAGLYFVLLISLQLSSTAGTSRYKHSRRHRDYTAASTESPIVVDRASPAVSPSSSQPDDRRIVSSKGKGPCLGKYCGAGRECEISPDGEVALCICVRRCSRRHRPVCGSDGRVYANHCELHRAACNSGIPLIASRLMRCLHRADDRPPDAPRVLPVGTAANLTLKPPDQKDTGQNDVKENTIDTDSYYLEDCSAQEYEIMKDNLLLFNHARLMAQDNHSKEYLVSIMFSHYDQNNNGNLEREELEQIAQREDLEQLSRGCSLGHMISYDDADKDGRLNINEFYMAFSKLYSQYDQCVSVVSLDKSREVNHVSVRVGDNVEIKCDVTGTPPPPLVWRRHEADVETLAEQEIRVFNDGSLYLKRVQLVHAGNYTCHALRNKDVVQTHVVTVHTVPEVRVTPRLQSKRPGEEATMWCHVVGEPLPRVEWLKNDEPLRLKEGDDDDDEAVGDDDGDDGEDDDSGKYDVVGNGTRLVVRNVGYADTGAYMCQATSVGGLTRDISSLVIQEQPTPTAASEERRFFSFHEWGISIYEPSACRLYHQIRSSDIIPGTQEYVCGEKSVSCSWGRAINVANRYVYVTQPEKDRILVISKIQMVVVDVVATDKYPVELHYVPTLDQVWLLNWRSMRDTGIKTVQVIRDAAQKRKHRTVHPEPIDGQFDLVKGLYIPGHQEIGHTYKYGYVTHTNQRGMYKLDLANMRYTRSVDLAPYSCVPTNIQFPALYGFVILQCEEPVTGRATGQLLLDYITDAVLAHKPGLVGRPLISPDSRHLVTLDRQESGVILVVQEILPSGLKFSFDVKTSLNISDITFYPSQTTHGCDLYASSTDKEDILFLNLATGKVEMITGVGKAMPTILAKWGNPNRPIVDSGVFGRYMVSPSSEALFVINGETRTVNCEIGGLVRPSAVVWLTVPNH
ncbi:follistatin-related protein 5 isoform X1 [Neodiprion lecontei]|uniref:Follistatin-related protein 5 isoform X1 n=1 Tax=Neodiprion lecontei TaxID=441921 RepID=A0A6J0C758_NEOLC|nr:follistatin-related protein 5 isoform X1 [Neodiprion lecontei]XP_046415124.1 follistatin-related protein 5-like isoform X1 [Neodiprion fabricii]XP_046589283.1 follistatin-related protein 5 isoform X1 [Neodiprion lecontei]